MKNNTFFIVFRQSDYKNIIANENQDRFGWELADGIEIFNYDEAKKMMQEYQAVMKDFVVRIRCIPIVR